MSGLSEANLIESLTWSNESYNLPEFLREYSLPQLVRVVQGYDGGRDSTCLGADEVLMLHTLRSAPVLAAQDNQGQAITIPVDCPHELQLLPKLEDCRSTICGVEELITLFPKATFLQVVKYDTENKCESIKEDEYFEILSVDKKNKKIKIKHTTGGQTAILFSKCKVLFTPLLDWRSHRISDLKSRFGFPARVRFLHAKGEGIPNTEREKQRLVTSETDLTIIEESTDDLIVATTAGKKNENKFCYEIPKDLQLRVQGLEQNEAENKKMISTFDKRFDVSNLPEAQQLSLFKRRDSILEYNFESMKHLFHSIPGLNTANAVKSAEVDKERQLEGSISPPLPPRRSRPSSFRTGLERRPIKPKGFETAQEDNSTILEKEEILNAYQERKPRSLSAPDRPETLKLKSLVKTPPVVPKRDSSLKASTDQSSSHPGTPVTAFKTHARSPNVPKEISLTFQSGQENLSNESESNVSPELQKSIQHDANDIISIFKKTQQRESIRKKPVESPNVFAVPLPGKIGHEIKDALEPKSITSQIPSPSSKLNPDKPSIQKCPEKSTEDTPGDRILQPSQEPTEIEADDIPKLPPRVALHPAIQQDTNSEDVGEISDDLYEDIDQFDIRAHNSSSQDSTYQNIARVPQDLSILTTKGVGYVLNSLRMERYVATFGAEQIDGTLLKKLRERDLESLGVSTFHATKLIAFIDGWRPKQ